MTCTLQHFQLKANEVRALMLLCVCVLTVPTRRSSMIPSVGVGAGGDGRVHGQGQHVLELLLRRARPRLTPNKRASRQLSAAQAACIQRLLRARQLSRVHCKCWRYTSVTWLSAPGRRAAAVVPPRRHRWQYLLPRVAAPDCVLAAAAACVSQCSSISVCSDMPAQPPCLLVPAAGGGATPPVRSCAEK